MNVKKLTLIAKIKKFYKNFRTKEKMSWLKKVFSLQSSQETKVVN